MFPKAKRAWRLVRSVNEALRGPVKTDRLLILPFSEEFLTETYVGWLNDADVTRHSEQRHQLHTIESCREYWRSFDGSASCFWAITVRDDNRHIENITAAVDAPNRIADISLLIGEKSLWGQGYGAEAWCGICNFLFAEANMNKVTGGTMATNYGMLSIMRKAGMTEEGRRTRQFLWEGKQIDLVQVALFRDQRRHET